MAPTVKVLDPLLRSSPSPSHSNIKPSLVLSPITFVSPLRSPPSLSPSLLRACSSPPSLSLSHSVTVFPSSPSSLWPSPSLLHHPSSLSRFPSSLSHPLSRSRTEIPLHLKTPKSPNPYPRLSRSQGVDSFKSSRFQPKKVLFST